MGTGWWGGSRGGKKVGCGGFTAKVPVGIIVVAPAGVTASLFDPFDALPDLLQVAPGFCRDRLDRDDAGKPAAILVGCQVAEVVCELA